MGVSLVSPEDQIGGSGSSGGLTNAELRAAPVLMEDTTTGNLLDRIFQRIMAPLGYDKSLTRYRGTVVVETLPTLATVTTVGTVSNQTNIGGFNADAVVRAQINTAWNLNVRARIT